MKNRVFIAGGGTGGHYFPALAVAEVFYKRGHEITFFGSKNGIEANTEFPFGNSYLYNIKGIRGKTFKEKFRNLTKLFKASLDIYKKIKAEDPSQIIVFGGYASAPLGLAAILARKPIYIHEQNSIPSSTNKILSYFARKIFISFEYTFKFFPKRKTILTGLPIRALVKKDKYLSKETAKKKLEIPEDKTVVLILGGSQGAKKLNEVGLKLVKKRKDLFFILITGKGFFEVIDAENVIRFKFCERMGLVYRASDIAISRAGAGAVSELIYYGIPTIFVPYPFAFKNHQYYNAKWLEDKGLAKIIKNEELTVNTASEAIDEFLKKDIEKLSKEIETLHISNSEDKIYEEIQKDWFNYLGLGSNKIKDKNKNENKNKWFF